MLFDEKGGPPPGRNLIRLRLGNNDGVTFALQAKTPGPDLDSQEVDLDVDFAAALGERQSAYERLLGDALIGSLRRFARQDIVEGTWRVVQPALDAPGEIIPYFRGSWGPADADDLLAPGDHWFPPAEHQD
jgi:glucose-6-phosphate 1-dehydrogenase